MSKLVFYDALSKSRWIAFTRKDLFLVPAGPPLSCGFVLLPKTCWNQEMWTTNSGSLAANFGRKCNNIKELKGWFSVASLSFGNGTLPLLSHGQDVKCYFEREKCQNALKAQNLGWFLQLHHAVDDLWLSQTGCQIQLLSGGHWFSISRERYKYWNQLCFHLNSAKMMTIADTSWSKLAVFYWR